MAKKAPKAEAISEMAGEACRMIREVLEIERDRATKRAVLRAATREATRRAEEDPKT